ncbi:MAG: Rpn family recombination-promoting nuclease/putative transposase [Desulfosporosinus sp.]|nr:Rpn family recombination-promoting nuclease/putative transposase [Desulfosporosinus sp.]
MYTSQVKPGDTYSKLKKCIAINIVDFKCTPLQIVYTDLHLSDRVFYYWSAPTDGRYWFYRIRQV